MKKGDARKLLTQPEDRGYPEAFLLSRVRGRRALLIRNWRPLVFQATELDRLSGAVSVGRAGGPMLDDSWKGLLREYRWIYSRMGAEQRRIFAPFFLYAELRTLFIALRQGEGAGRDRSAHLLAESLLAVDIKTSLLGSDEVMTRVQVIEDAFCALSPDFSGLSDALKGNGLRGVEQKMVQAFLAWARGAELDSIMHLFFQKIIDARNLLGLYKAVRFEVKTKPVFLSGGTVTGDQFNVIADQGAMNDVSALIRRVLGVSIEAPDMTMVERALYQGVTRSLGREAKDPLGSGMILDYLWRCSIEAMNLSILAQTKNIDREAVAEEMVQ